jgi:hypothetical protein
MRLVSIQLVLKIGQSEGNFDPHTWYEAMGDTILQLFYSRTGGLIGVVCDARWSGLENFFVRESTPD